MTTLWINMWLRSIFCTSSYMTLYDFREFFATSTENEYLHFSFAFQKFLFCSCLICRKSYMIFLRYAGNHTIHITLYDYWPWVKSGKVEWWLARVYFKNWPVRATIKYKILLYRCVFVPNTLQKRKLGYIYLPTFIVIFTLTWVQFTLDPLR